MQGVGKMRRTDEMTVTLAKRGSKPRVFTVSTAVAREVESLLRRPEKRRTSIPAEEVLPELADDTLRPAVVLRGSRYKEEMTQAALAKRLGIRQNHVSEMENCKRPIGREMARKLAVIFECDYRVFL
jgi:ribosome-binding protein aMBF1 (putative translation factor)